MNLNIFYDDVFYNELSELFTIDERDPIFPFKEMRIDPDNLVRGIHDATAIYTFLKDVHFLYQCDQKYIGYVKIDGIDYIIDIDDEATISILGDDEVNWTKDLLDDEQYLYFKNFCLNHYQIKTTEPDYEKFSEIERKFLTF